MKKYYIETLKRQKEKNLYRKLVEDDVAHKNLISFASNDYLGLSQNPAVKKAASDAIEKYGVGSGASRYVSGNNSLYTKLEKQIAHMKGCDDAIIFSSGYSCAIGVIPALAAKGDLIIGDKLIHASLIDGAQLSGAKLMRFLHNDVAHARKILEENRSKFKKCLIVTETVFSMDGDLGEIEKLLELVNEFDAILLSDAAHDLFLQTSTLPRHPEQQPRHPERSDGSQELELRTLTPEIPHFVRDDGKGERNLKMGTLSKAVGSLGGYIAGDEVLIDYLRNFSRSQIYSTALPASVLAASLASLEIIEKESPGEKALENAQYFCELMDLPKAQSAIIPIITYESKKTLEIAQKIQEKGFLISAIRPPTVENNKARLRVTFSSEHKKSQIKELAQSLKEFI